MAELVVSGLRAGYGGQSVLHDVDLTAASGRVVAIVGPNGAGKSTLLTAIAGGIEVMAGSASLDGRRLDTRSQRDRVLEGLGLVPQRNNVFGDLNVEENLRLGASTVPTPRSVDELYELFPVLGERRRQGARTLSGGERQMLAIGTAVVAAPRCLLLDEPTTGLAPVIVQALVRGVRRLADKGTTVVWVVEEDPARIVPVADVVHTLVAGSMSPPTVPEDWRPATNLTTPNHDPPTR